MRAAALALAVVVSFVLWLGIAAVVCLALACWPMWLGLAACLVMMRYEP